MTDTQLSATDDEHEYFKKMYKYLIKKYWHGYYMYGLRDELATKYATEDDYPDPPRWMSKELRDQVVDLKETTND